ncbi:hypothetical protein [Hahella ganghwensis]|uniref:hypothetical protein n=1 Tax=Hahella ganghwensis TaxID=286420 RepID=UPI00036E126F|nr:hypothetical protein [Hahella ganghwensis]
MMVRIAITLLAVCMALPAFAHQSASRLDVATMAKQSDLVFRGKVVDINYRQSEAKGQLKPLPYTYVTYAVDEVLHGQYQESELTLRFLGGITEQGEIMMNTSSPHMDMGDEDILFVQDNGGSECPLVDCSMGRLRVIHGEIYSEYGQSLVQNSKGQLVFGKSAQLDEVNSFQIGDRTFQHNVNRKQAQEGDREASKSLTVEGVPLQSGNISGLMREHIFSSNTKDPYGLSKNVRNLDINAPILPPQAKPVTLPEPRQDKSQALSHESSTELEAIKRNNGNPVLKDQ